MFRHQQYQTSILQCADDGLAVTGKAADDRPRQEPCAKLVSSWDFRLRQDRLWSFTMDEPTSLSNPHVIELFARVLQEYTASLPTMAISTIPTDRSGSNQGPANIAGVSARDGSGHG
ncbi:MAG: hypothetical protein SGJ26_12860 [Nitrospirota bacterium]|nr:hypothetical protein [Nitrospirota bacterium]